MMANLETLIVRWGAGDEAAAEEIYNLHRERVFRLSYALVGNPEDAEEAAQDALTYALLHIHNFDSRRSKFTTWLHMITVSRCRDLLRKRRLPTLSLSDWLEKMRTGLASQGNPEQDTLQKESQNIVWEAVQELSPALREAIVLRHWGGHTYQEIADILGCPIRTAQSRVRLAYQRLKIDLAESNQPVGLREEPL
jgi:RNA polymerase sigma-70 factor (ECF subfamily)